MAGRQIVTPVPVVVRSDAMVLVVAQSAMVFILLLLQGSLGVYLGRRLERRDIAAGKRKHARTQR